MHGQSPKGISVSRMLGLMMKVWVLLPFGGGAPELRTDEGRARDDGLPGLGDGFEPKE